MLSRILGAITLFSLVFAAGYAAPASVTIVHLGQNDVRTDEWYQELAVRFKEETGINVELNLSNSGQIQEKLMVMLMGGMSPDTLEATMAYLAPFDVDELLEDLTPWMRKSGIKESEFPAPFLEYGRTEKGALVGIPYQLWTYGPAYNETLLLNLGLAVPTPGWTWETLEEIATKATRIRPDGVTESLGMNWPIYWTRLHPLVRAGGGDYLDRRVNPTRSTLLSEGVIRALSLIDRISERGGLDGSWGTQFHSGKAALSFNAGPNVGERVLGAFEFGWLPYPKGPSENTGGEFTPFYAMMMRNTPHKEEAWLWIQFMAHNDRNLRRFYEITQRIPGRIRIAQVFFQELQAKNSTIMNLYAMMTDPTSFARYSEWEPYMGIVDEWARKALVNRSVPLQEALIQADRIINAKLAAGE